MTQPFNFPANDIWERLSPSSMYSGAWETFRHQQQSELLHQLVGRAKTKVEMTSEGQSDEGCVLHTLYVGNGKKRVMVWARQHGNEPDCSAGLAMALEELFTRPTEEPYKTILDNLSLAIMPMVNPDGVARYTRRNALGIDLNRDAIEQTTLEGKALVQLKDKFNPELAFNLHDMDCRKSDGKGNLIALAFQSCPPSARPQGTDEFERGRRVIGLMAALASDYAPNGTARYTADYMPKAFGDNMANWGVSTILIESGGWYSKEGGDNFVQRLFALCLLRGLYAVAMNEDLTAEAELYELIPFDGGKKFTNFILEGGSILNGAGRPPFRADLAVNQEVTIHRKKKNTTLTSSIENIGDLEFELGKQRVSMKEQLLLPGLAAISPGATFPNRALNQNDVAPYLQAGITTLATGVGPFASNRSRKSWLETIENTTPPLNILAFERVASLSEISRRHGTTEMAGFLVQDLEIRCLDVLALTHLFHPAIPSTIEQGRENETLALDLFFQGAASPEDARVHLHLSPISSKNELKLIRTEDLRFLTDQFVTTPEQITMSADALDDPPPKLPTLIGYGGLTDGRLPNANFLGNILENYGSGDMSGVVAALNMLMRNTVHAFRLNNRGRIDMEKTADLIAFDQKILTGDNQFDQVIPNYVMLNGSPVLENGILSKEPAPGTWILAQRI
jgi:Zinc carboxypeptidase